MKKLVTLLLVVALLFGFGFTVSHPVVVAPPAIADDTPTPPLPPTQWPPCSNSITKFI